MGTLASLLNEALSDPPRSAAYAEAMVAAAMLLAVLGTAFLVVKGIYLVLRLFTHAAASSTLMVVALIIGIGWLNR
jgi:hypothetical protein